MLLQDNSLVVSIIHCYNRNPETQLLVLESKVSHAKYQTLPDEQHQETARKMEIGHSEGT